MLPIAGEIATRLTRDQAHSALPHAPVVDPQPSTAIRDPSRGRLALARALRRLAERVEPAQPRRTPAC